MTDTQPRFTYASGYKTAHAADTALGDLYAGGEVCEGERPEIESYKARNKITGKPVTRYKITMRG